MNSTIQKITLKFLFDDDGNKTGVMLSNKDFDEVIEELEDYDDYRIIKKRAGKIGKTYTREEVLEELEARK